MNWFLSSHISLQFPSNWIFSRSAGYRDEPDEPCTISTMHVDQ